MATVTETLTCTQTGSESGNSQTEIWQSAASSEEVLLGFSPTPPHRPITERKRPPDRRRQHSPTATAIKYRPRAPSNKGRRGCLTQ